MNITALHAQWTHEKGGYFCKVPPPGDEELQAYALQRIQQCKEAEKNLTPPPLTGYGMFVGDGTRTIADDIADVAWARECWELALACPDDRPPLYAGLLLLASGLRPDCPSLGRDTIWIDDGEVSVINAAWRDHESPLGKLAARMYELRDRWAYKGGRATAFRPPAADLAAMIQWRSRANLVEVGIASRFGRCPDWSVLPKRLAWARAHAGLNTSQVAKLLDQPDAMVQGWEAWWRTGEQVTAPSTEQVARLAELFEVRLDFLVAGTVFDLAAHPDIWTPLEGALVAEPTLLDTLLTIREAQP